MMSPLSHRERLNGNNSLLGTKGQRNRGRGDRFQPIIDRGESNQDHLTFLGDRFPLVGDFHHSFVEICGKLTKICGKFTPSVENCDRIFQTIPIHA